MSVPDTALRRGALVAALALLTAATLPAQQGAPDPGEAEAGAAALALADEWLDAWNELDAERMATLHDRELNYYWRGRPRGYETFMNELHQFIIPYYQENGVTPVRVVDPRVQVLGPTMAIVGFQMGEVDMAADEEPGGAVSMVVVKREAGWKIVHIHESPVRDGGSD